MLQIFCEHLHLLNVHVRREFILHRFAGFQFWGGGGATRRATFANAHLRIDLTPSTAWSPDFLSKRRKQSKNARVREHSTVDNLRRTAMVFFFHRTVTRNGSCAHIVNLQSFTSESRWQLDTQRASYRAGKQLITR